MARVILTQILYMILILKTAHPFLDISLRKRINVIWIVIEYMDCHRIHYEKEGNILATEKEAFEYILSQLEQEQ